MEVLIVGILLDLKGLIDACFTLLNLAFLMTIMELTFMEINRSPYEAFRVSQNYQLEYD